MQQVRKRQQMQQMKNTARQHPSSALPPDELQRHRDRRRKNCVLCGVFEGGQTAPVPRAHARGYESDTLRAQEARAKTHTQPVADAMPSTCRRRPPQVNNCKKLTLATYVGFGIIRRRKRTPRAEAEDWRRQRRCCTVEWTHENTRASMLINGGPLVTGVKGETV